MSDIAGSLLDRRQRGHERERHRPEDTLLYRLVADHLEAFLQETTRSTIDRSPRTWSESSAGTCAAGS